MFIQRLIDSGFLRARIHYIGEWLVTTLPAILFICLATWVGLKLLAAFFNRLRKKITAKAGHGPAATEHTKRVETFLGIIHLVLQAALVIEVALVVLTKLGIDIGPIIAGAGIMGLAIGFGAQEMVRDLISGLFLLMDNQIRVGDVASINGTTGLVESIGLRTISLRDQGGVVHIFQNGKINTLANQTKEWSAALFDISVTYETDIDTALYTMKTVGAELAADPAFEKQLLDGIEIMGVDQFLDTGIVLRARIKTLPNEQWRIAREFRRRLKAAFDEAGIRMPPRPKEIVVGRVDAMPVVVDSGQPPAA